MPIELLFPNHALIFTLPLDRITQAFSWSDQINQARQSVIPCNTEEGSGLRAWSAIVNTNVICDVPGSAVPPRATPPAASLIGTPAWHPNYTASLIKS